MTTADHIRHATEHAALTLQSDYVVTHPRHSESYGYCPCHQCDDRSEQVLTSAKCPRCGHPLDYCHRHGGHTEGTTR